MDEASSNLQRIAMNLTKVEFDGHCKGMQLQWLFRAVDDTSRNTRSNKKLSFWDKACDKYSHNCKD